MKKLIITFLAFFFVLAKPTSAYYTHMPASVVVGQQNFSSAAANQGSTLRADTLSSPSDSIIADGKLLVYDSVNKRILIWNSVPARNNVPADVVIGQTDMVTNSSGCSASKINPGDSALLYVQGKLLVSDAGNSRVLIFNSIPTTNGASADVVIGQSNMTGCSVNKGGSASQSSLNVPSQLAYADGKLFIVDASNHRVLIFNSIPTTNDASADTVVGQPNFTSSSSGTSATALNNPRGVAVSNGKLIVGIRSTFRIHIWNTIPTTNGAAADVVLGQASFIANVSSPPALSSSVHPFLIATDSKGRLYSSDRNSSRYLIWNQIPVQNNQSADIVIGQPDFTSSTTNNGGVSARSVGLARSIFVNDTKMVIADSSNNRVLIFDNTVQVPGLSLTNNVESRGGDIFKMSGNAYVDEPYLLNSIKYSVNGGSWNGVTAADGGVDESNEDFTFEFDTKANGYRGEGFVVQVKAKNNNADGVDRLTYFEPFRLNAPENNARTDNQLPSFSFTVNSQRQLLYEGLQKYMVMVKKGREDWRVYADEIPVNYDYAKDKAENTAEKKSGTNGNGVYEDAKIKVSYTEDGSRLEVYSKEEEKKIVGGSYQWKVVTVDKAGHTQETGARYLRVASSSIQSGMDWFPLTIEFISGIGKTDISTLHPETTKATYITNSGNPTISGTAVSGSLVTISLTERNCVTNECTKTFTSIADLSSKYTFKLPSNSIKLGKKYDFIISVSSDQEYNELPSFVLRKKGIE